MTPLEELLETEAIRKLRVRYSHCFDGKRVADLVDLFTDDAVCEFGPAFGGDWVGKAQSAYSLPSAVRRSQVRGSPLTARRST
jgi:hypothetical protein